jgi:hypothetical protein
MQNPFPYREGAGGGHPRENANSSRYSLLVTRYSLLPWATLGGT